MAAGPLGAIKYENPGDEAIIAKQKAVDAEINFFNELTRLTVQAMHSDIRQAQGKSAGNTAAFEQKFSDLVSTQHSRATIAALSDWADKSIEENPNSGRLKQLQDALVKLSAK